MKIMSIFGTRPEIIRMSRIFELLYNNFDHIESIGPLSKEKALEMLKLLNLKNKNPPKEFWENMIGWESAISS